MRSSVSCSPSLPIIHPSAMESRAFPMSPCLLHGFISPFPACEPGPGRERDPCSNCSPQRGHNCDLEALCTVGNESPFVPQGKVSAPPSPSRLDLIHCEKLLFHAPAPLQQSQTRPSPIQRRLLAGQQSHELIQLGQRVLVVHQEWGNLLLNTATPSPQLCGTRQRLHNLSSTERTLLGEWRAGFVGFSKPHITLPLHALDAHICQHQQHQHVSIPPPPAG